MEAFVARKPGASRNRRGASRKRTRKGSQQVPGQRGGNTAEVGKMTVFKGLPSLGKIVDRWFTNKGTLSSNGGGTIPIAVISANDIIAALGTEFSNFGQEFQEYRVDTIEVNFLPATVNATSVTGPYQGAMEIAPWQQFRPATLSTLDQSAEMRTFSSLEEENFRFYPKFSNERLWTPTGTALAADRDFGLSYGSFGATMAVSSVIFSVAQRIHAVFRIPQ